MIFQWQFSLVLERFLMTATHTPFCILTENVTAVEVNNAEKSITTAPKTM